MSTFDAVIKAIGAIGFVLSIVLGAQIYRLGPERRKIDAEGRAGDANAAKVVSETAILYVREWRDELDTIHGYVDALEASIDEWAEWARKVAQVVELRDGATLPPVPARPKRPRQPPRHNPPG